MFVEPTPNSRDCGHGGINGGLLDEPTDANVRTAGHSLGASSGEVVGESVPHAVFLDENAQHWEAKGLICRGAIFLCL